ncbi:hypothetical protein [Pelagibacterium lentulum]|uniref:Uncharacterized protein n=1 Tax=Pelagibacterium lentulum TaxID=2029865 RepID=A0A916VWS5_9HYPH|nr:hypothetical protein [Pelagibacterium lentulum]GGA45656.1 hypothetical protein GCM10011499_14230 [Pelagibacterium lentulum]
MKPNVFFALSAVVCGLTIALHVFEGGPEFPEIALASGLDAKQSSMYMILWHAVTLLLTVATAAYAAAALRSTYRPAVLFIGILFVSIAVLFLVVGQSMLGTIWVLPQWIIFLAIVALSLPGFRKPVQTAEQV